MLEDKVNERLLEIKDYEKYFLFEVSGTYINFLLEPHNTSSCRKELLKFYREGMKYSKLEKEILSIVKNSRQSDRCLGICEEILSDLDNIHLRVFSYNEWVIDEYENALKEKRFNTPIVCERKFDIFSEETKENLIKRLSKSGD